MKSLYESILSSTNDGRESIIQSIETWLKKYGIKLYTINDKLEVNLLGGADLNKKELKELPYGFGATIGYSMIMDDVKTVDDAINEATLDMRNKKENQ